AKILQLYLASFGLSRSMQIERYRKMVRCSHRFMHLPVVRLNRTAHECPVDMASRVQQMARRSGWEPRGWHSVTKSGLCHRKPRTLLRYVQIQIAGDNQGALWLISCHIAQNLVDLREA